MAGWIKIGTYVTTNGEGKWTTMMVGGLHNKTPNSLLVEEPLQIGVNEVHFVQVRFDKPPKCNPDKLWFDDENNKKNSIPKGMLVYVKEKFLVLHEGCDIGVQEVWAEVSPIQY